MSYQIINVDITHADRYEARGTVSVELSDGSVKDISLGYQGWGGWVFSGDRLPEPLAALYQDPELIAEFKEAVMYQRDLLREKN